MMISFKAGLNNIQSKPENIENQVKQVMRENYSSMENVVVEKCTQKINNQFLDEFKDEIRKTQNQVGKKDLVNILSTLKTAYSKSGLDNDAKAIEAQINKLDVQW